MFETASKLKLRFPTKKGKLTTEDLWDLPLQSATGVSLDAIAISLNRKIKAQKEESFVKTKSKNNKELETMFNIVKRVIEVRLETASRAKANLIRKEKREQILRIMADKENDELRGKSLEELKKMLD